MKKKKPIKTPMVSEMFIPSKKKEILKVLQDPKKMQAVLELGRAASNLQQNISNSKTLEEWAEKVVLLLPNDMKDIEDFTLKFMEFVNEYRNKSEDDDRD